MMTRKQLADAIDALDVDIAELNAAKADAYATYRADLENALTKAAARQELAATKAAIAKRRKMKADAQAVMDADTLADEILAEIMDLPHMRTRTREAAE